MESCILTYQKVYDFINKGNFFLGLFLFSVVRLVSAQPNSDSAVVQSIQYEVNQLLKTPINLKKEQDIFYNLNVAMAYSEWIERQHISPYMSTAKKFDYYYNRARSEFLFGTQQAIAMMLYAPSGSGVFPLLDYAIAHLDSARFNYGEVNKYAVSALKVQLKADSITATQLSDTLKNIRARIFRENSFNALREFDLAKFVEKLFGREFKTAELKRYDGSISKWLYITYLEP